MCRGITKTLDAQKTYSTMIITMIITMVAPIFKSSGSDNNTQLLALTPSACSQGAYIFWNKDNWPCRSKDMHIFLVSVHLVFQAPCEYAKAQCKYGALPKCISLLLEGRLARSFHTDNSHEHHLNTGCVGWCYYLVIEDLDFGATMVIIMVATVGFDGFCASKIF